MTLKCYTWINVAKVVGLYLMILGHGGLASENVTTYIYSFHMPLFFILSGTLYNPKPFEQQLTSDLKSLILPYLIVNLLCFIYALLVTLYLGELNFQWVFSRLGAIGLGLGYNVGIWIPVCTPMWFFIALFICRALLSLLNLNNNPNIKLLIATVISIFLVCILRLFKIDTYIPLDSALLAMPFICFGYAAKKIILAYIRFPIQCVLIPVLLISGYFLSGYNGRVDLCTLKWGDSIFVMYVNAIITCFAIFEICKLLNINSQILNKIPRYSSVIVGFNLIFISFLKGFIVKDEGGLIIALFVMMICCLLGFVSDRFFPAILGYRKLYEKK